MADNTAQITAGLPVAKNSGQTPTSSTVYLTAGLPAKVETATTIPKIPWHLFQQRAA